MRDTPSPATTPTPSKAKKPKNTSMDVIRSNVTTINDITIGGAKSFNGNQKVCAGYACKNLRNRDDVARDDKIRYSVKLP